MPLVVKEIVISVDVENKAAGAPAAVPTQDQQAIVAECVERVLEILRQREER